MTPEHLHVALNHLPLIGLAAACVPLIYSLIRKDRNTLIVGCLMAVLFAIPIPIVMSAGEEAEERFEEGMVTAPLDGAGAQWMHEHEERAEVAAVVVYVAGALGLAGLLVAWRMKKLEAEARIVVLVVCLAGVGLLLWVADSGGKVRHPELRDASGAWTLPSLGSPGESDDDDDD